MLFHSLSQLYVFFNQFLDSFAVLTLAVDLSLDLLFSGKVSDDHEIPLHFEVGTASAASEQLAQIAVFEDKLCLLLVVVQFGMLADAIVLLHDEGHKKRQEDDGSDYFEKDKQDEGSHMLVQRVKATDVGVTHSKSHTEDKGVSEINKEGSLAKGNFSFLTESQECFSESHVDNKEYTDERFHLPDHVHDHPHKMTSAVK